MFPTVYFVHSYWAYLVLIVLTITVIKTMQGYFLNKEYSAVDFRLALFTLITAHIQFLIGLVLYFVSPWFQSWSGGMGELMKNSEARLYLVEHPLMMLIAIILITIGYSKHKKKLTSKPKFKLLAIFYAIALVVLLTRIPWIKWLGL